MVLAAAPALAARPKPAPAPVAAPVPPAPSVKQGVELWRAGDYAGAVAMWQPFANGNDADAMFNIGQAYKLGRAVPKDLGLARDWYRRAAAKGHLPAQANLGILLFQAGEKAEAVRWLKAAADKNEMRAQYVLGVASWNGDGVPRSMTLAYGYLARASAQGLPEAKTALDNLTGIIAPVERANGWAVATSLAGGNGVPPEFAPGAPRQALALNRDAVIKPLPPVTPPATPPVTPPVVFAKAAEPTAPAPTGIAAVNPAALPPSAQLVKPVQGPPPPSVAPVSVASSVPVRPPVPASMLTTPAPVRPATLPPARPAPLTAAASTPVPISAPVPQPAVRSATLEARPAAPPVASVAVPSSLPTPVETTAAVPVPTPRPAAVAAQASRPKTVETAALLPKPAVKLPPKPAGWRVQLGAFAKRAQAEVAWTDVATKQKQLVGKQRPIYQADGSVTKLQMGPYKDKTAARDACAKIAFTGRACFVTEG
ncbi:SPOR domain-containing protein [Sandarakinorhabdus sp. DWP1-3-1]|uniref:SPOR domain-containing protein n=1 Tax=Sandarakinorhabdus sp. DWP1-3-1 TaxID=2804627 RepID=UPI003CEC5B7B